jgi:hypothetical protein
VVVVPRAAATHAADGASIVCGLDGSPESENALRVAARLRRILDLRLVLVHVETSTRSYRQRRAPHRRRQSPRTHRASPDELPWL